MKQACVHVRVGMVCPSGPACEVPAPPSARGVRLAFGRLTRSGRRHGGTESGFEVGLRMVSSTLCPLGREPLNTQKRPSGDTEEAGKEGASHDPASFYHAEALAKPSRLRSRQASPSVNR